MEESEDDADGGFLIGVIVGIIAGAIAGFLLSPRSGTENREKLVEAIPGAPEVAKEAGEDLQERVEEAKEAYHEGAAETRAAMLRELEARRKGV